MKYFFINILVCFLIFFGGCAPDNNSNNNQDTPLLNIQEIRFSQIQANQPDPQRTLGSLKKEGGLFMITYYGDYTELLDTLNEKIITEGIDSVVPSDENSPYECSIFAAYGDLEHPIFGRNFDNNIERGVLVGLYAPPGGFSSICISRMSDMGFSRGEDPRDQPQEEKERMLNCVFFPVDGMNERGISIALATSENVPLVRDVNKKLVFVTYLLREVLDHSDSVEEAVEIIKRYDAFDANTEIVSNHFLISGPDGQSVIAEYYDGDWRFMYNNKSWQIVTNGIFFNVSEAQRRSNCIRYRTADDTLENASGRISWEEGMNILEAISVTDTQWSSLYDLNTMDVYISLYQNFDDIFQIAGFN